MHEQLVITVHIGHISPELAGHARQVWIVFAPTVVENVPDPHQVHVVVPVMVL